MIFKLHLNDLVSFSVKTLISTVFKILYMSVTLKHYPQRSSIKYMKYKCIQDRLCEGKKESEYYGKAMEWWLNGAFQFSWNGGVSSCVFWSLVVCRLSVRPSFLLHIFIFLFSRTTGPISIKLCTNYLLVRGFKFVQMMSPGDIPLM